MPGIVLHGHDQAGLTGSRPTNAEIGQPFYDTTAGQLLVWNGTAWQGMTVVPTEASQTVVSPIINCTGNVGDITGADDNFLILTANGKQNYYTTRTAAQLFGDIAGCAVQFGCAISIVAAGTATVTVFPGSGVTLIVGVTPGYSVSIAPGICRQFSLTFTSATTAILQTVGSGPWP